MIAPTNAQHCPSCGGVIGLDCFNPQECMEITQSMAAYQQHDSQQSCAVQTSLLDEARGLLIRAKNAAHKLEMNKLEREIDDFLERTK